MPIAETPPGFVSKIADILREKPRATGLPWFFAPPHTRRTDQPYRSGHYGRGDARAGHVYRGKILAKRPIPQVGTGIIVDGASNFRLASCRPVSGDHTDEVLRELLGIEEAHLQALALKSVTKKETLMTAKRSLTRRRPIGTITLNRPDDGNMFTVAMCHEIRDCINDIRRETRHESDRHHRAGDKFLLHWWKERGHGKTTLLQRSPDPRNVTKRSTVSKAGDRERQRLRVGGGNVLQVVCDMTMQRRARSFVRSDR